MMRQNTRVLPRQSMFLKLDRNTRDAVLFIYQNNYTRCSIFINPRRHKVKKKKLHTEHIASQMFTRSFLKVNEPFRKCIHDAQQAVKIF